MPSDETLARGVERPKLVVVRHAAVRTTGICYGHTDVEVVAQHGEVARRMADLVTVRPRFVWSSPSTRCMKPAAILAERYGVPLRIDDRLLELDFGTWEGREWLAIEARDLSALREWMVNWIEHGPPGGESARQLEARIRTWYAALEPYEAHLLVGHAGVIRALRVIAGGQDWPGAMCAAIPALGVHWFELGC